MRSLIFILLLISVGCRPNKTVLIFDSFVEDFASQKEWVDVLKKAIKTSTVDSQEIRRQFFALNPSTSKTYRDLNMYVNYFELVNIDMIAIRELLDEKDIKIFPIINLQVDDELTAPQLEKLLEVEQKVFNEMEIIGKEL